MGLAMARVEMRVDDFECRNKTVSGTSVDNRVNRTFLSKLINNWKAAALNPASNR